MLGELTGSPRINSKEWLRTEGSPASTISDAKFTSEQALSAPEFEDFAIVRGRRLD